MSGREGDSGAKDVGRGEGGAWEERTEVTTEFTTEFTTEHYTAEHTAFEESQFTTPPVGRSAHRQLRRDPSSGGSGSGSVSGTGTTGAGSVGGSGRGLEASGIDRLTHGDTTRLGRTFARVGHRLRLASLREGWRKWNAYSVVITLNEWRTAYFTQVVVRVLEGSRARGAAGPLTHAGAFHRWKALTLACLVEERSKVGIETDNLRNDLQRNEKEYMRKIAQLEAHGENWEQESRKLSAENAELRRLVDSHGHSDDELRKNVATIQKLKDELARTRADSAHALDKMQGDLESSQREADDALQRLRHEVAEANSEVASLREELERKEAELEGREAMPPPEPLPPPPPPPDASSNWCLYLMLITMLLALAWLLAERAGFFGAPTVATESCDSNMSCPCGVPGEVVCEFGHGDFPSRAGF